MLMSDGPHQTNIGNREFRQMLTAMRRLRGHCCGGPSGVADQSMSPSNRAVGDSVPVAEGSPSSKGWGLGVGSVISGNCTCRGATDVQSKPANHASELA